MVEVADGYWKRIAGDGAFPIVMHSCHPNFWTETYVLPYAVLVGYKVSEAFADERQASEGCEISERDLKKDVYDDFGG